nr:MAG TPA: hypothetical protein [Caudoviricetes sp.]
MVLFLPFYSFLHRWSRHTISYMVIVCYLRKITYIFANIKVKKYEHVKTL